MMYLAHWTRKLSWTETARSFRSSWEKIFHAAEFVLQWGLQQRSLDSLKSIGVDKIQYGRGHPLNARPCRVISSPLHPFSLQSYRGDNYSAVGG